MGPPVYFVVNNTAGHLDLSSQEDQNKFCLGLPGQLRSRLGASRSVEFKRSRSMLLG